MIRNVLLKEKNTNGLGGLELSVMVGSPLYFIRVLEFEGVLKKTKMIQRSDRSTSIAKWKRMKAILALRKVQSAPPPACCLVTMFPCTCMKAETFFKTRVSFYRCFPRENFWK